MTKIKEARKELAEHLEEHLGMQGRSFPDPARDTRSVHLKPSDNDDGYVAKADDRATWGEWVVTYIARIGLVHQAEEASFDEIDDIVASLQTAFPYQSSETLATADLVRVITPGSADNGDTPDLHVDAVVTLFLPSLI